MKEERDYINKHDAKKSVHQAGYLVIDIPVLTISVPVWSEYKEVAQSLRGKENTVVKIIVTFGSEV